MMTVIEGLDGAGKSTQVAFLKKYLEERGSLSYIHFPRYDAPLWGDLIGRYLRGDLGSIDSVHPRLVALLYALDRKDAAPLIRESQASGSNVLLDRYVYSNIAYQCAKTECPSEREALRQWIIDMEYGNFALPRPDVNIFLDVPLSFVEGQLARHREGVDRDYLGTGSRDIHEESMSFQARVRQEYLALCAQDPHFIRIDCSAPDGSMLPSEVISSKIIKALGL